MNIYVIYAIATVFSAVLLGFVYFIVREKK